MLEIETNLIERAKKKPFALIKVKKSFFIVFNADANILFAIRYRGRVDRFLLTNIDSGEDIAKYNYRFEAVNVVKNWAK